MAVCGTNDWDEEKLLNLISAYNVVFLCFFYQVSLCGDYTAGDAYSFGRDSKNRSLFIGVP